jgi:16S rRNA (cytosine967-C5)-methyltransferase
MAESRDAEAKRLRVKSHKPGHAARRLAALAHNLVLAQNWPIDEALNRANRDFNLNGRDLQLARTLATVALKRRGGISRILAACLERGIPRKSGRLADILAIGAAQLLFLDIADHAAVDAAVADAKSDQATAGYAGLVNAVLRRIGRERAGMRADIADPAIDIPGWLATRWQTRYGAAAFQAMAETLRAEAHVDITVRDRPEFWAERLGGFVLANGSVRLDNRQDIAELPGFAEGQWWVQDAAASLPARLLRVRPAETCIDLCAAPGGKTAQLAAAGAHVLAVDRSAKRLERLAANLARLQLRAAIRACDVETLVAEPAPAVLLDAPCSATGTLRRNPDIAWTKSTLDIARFAALQERLLARAFALTAPGGRLVYSTCSLEPEEGEERMRAFLGKHPEARRMPIEPAEIPGFEAAVTAEGDLRVLPHLLPHDEPRLAGVDGFFIARLGRLGN